MVSQSGGGRSNGNHEGSRGSFPQQGQWRQGKPRQEFSRAQGQRLPGILTTVR